MEFKDYYSTLGVAKTATEKEIKQAYRKLARKHHPDVNPGNKSAEAKSKDINEAYEVLGDPPKRKKYDELGSNWRMYEQAGAPGAAPPGAGGAWNVDFGGGDPFSDFFHAFFGGAVGPMGGHEAGRSGRASPGGRARGPRQGRDLEHELELGLEDAHNGAMRRLSLTHYGQARTVDVRIPPGVGDGSRVRIGGEGEHGAGGAPSGDLYLRIRLARHPKFERKGRDLYTHVSVPLTTAVLGGEAEVGKVAGKPARLKIPPTTQNGQVFRLKGHGMPAVGKPNEHGDLYATVEVELPRSLTSDQRTHFEALQKLETVS